MKVKIFFTTRKAPIVIQNVVELREIDENSMAIIESLPGEGISFIEDAVAARKQYYHTEYEVDHIIINEGD